MDKAEPITWRDRTKQILKERGLNQDVLKEVWNVGQSSVSQKLNGHKDVSIGEIMALAKYLNVNIDYLVEGKTLSLNQDEKDLILQLRELPEAEQNFLAKASKAFVK